MAGTGTRVEQGGDLNLFGRGSVTPEPVLIPYPVSYALHAVTIFIILKTRCGMVNCRNGSQSQHKFCLSLAFRSQLRCRCITYVFSGQVYTSPDRTLSKAESLRLEM